MVGIVDQAGELPGFTVAVHRALTEPILLGGAPRAIAIMNGTLAGAVGLGLLAAIHFHPQREALMHKLKLDSDSVVLVISTEGDTDVKHYREVVWEGKHPAAQ